MTTRLTRRGFVLGLAAGAGLATFGAQARRADRPVSMAAAGMRADGSDQQAAIQKLLSAGTPLDGEGATYCVSNNLRLMDGGLIQNATIKYIGPDIGKMNEYGVITAIKVSEPAILNVRIDRNSPKTKGQPCISGGLAIIGCKSPVVKDCEITGDGRGCGVLWRGKAGGRLSVTLIHDMTWEDDGASDDVLVGLALDGINTDNLISRVTVKNLFGFRAAGFPRGETRFKTKAVWTRGISHWTEPGGSGNQFADCQVSNVGQGFDTPGRGLSFERCSVTDCYTWGFKQNHNGDGTKFTDCVATRCGYAGFVFTQTHATAALNVRNIRLVRCRSIDSGTSDCTGSPTTSKTPVGEPALWGDPKPSGFLISGTAGLKPENIEIIGGEATDRYGRMAYAINNVTASRSIRADRAFVAKGFVRAATENVGLSD